MKRQASIILLTVKRLRETTGASAAQVVDYYERRGYAPFQGEGANARIRAFLEDSFVRRWTQR